MEGKIIFKSEVIDNEDTFLLGRIRCKPKDWKIQSILDDLAHKGIYNPATKDIYDQYKYTKDDPFVFMPLLPQFFSLVPKVGELVWLTYSNAVENWGKKEQFYISVVKSSPFNLFYENWSQSQSMTNEGVNFIKGTEYKNPVISIDITDVNKFKYPQRQYIGAGKNARGLFAEPGDNAFYGQGTTDIILKEDEILIRAGKTDMTPNKINVVNKQRGFFQLSYYKTQSKIKDPVTVGVRKIDESPLRKLIEYRIDNLENQFDLFNGFIYIYDIAASLGLKNNEFTANTDFPLPIPFYSVEFNSKPLSSITETINYIINSLNEGRIERKEEPILVESRTFTNVFPFFYRPASSMRPYLGLTPSFTNGTFDFYKSLNANKLARAVRFSRALVTAADGDGLVSQKNKFGISNFTEQITTSETQWSANRNSVGVMGSNHIVFLSHESIVPGKQQVNLNVEGDTSTIYGLSQDQIFGDVFPNTEPMVRGEKLKEFLTLITSFLVSHTHAFPGTPPAPVSYSQVAITDIEQAFQNYDQNVINQNIRIN
jgi:hypothetical protein